MSNEQRRATAFKLSAPLETAEPSRNYARVPGYKKKYKKKTRKGRENKEKKEKKRKEKKNERKGK